MYSRELRDRIEAVQQRVTEEWQSRCGDSSFGTEHAVPERCANVRLPGRTAPAFPPVTVRRANKKGNYPCHCGTKSFEFQI